MPRTIVLVLLALFGAAASAILTDAHADPWNGLPAGWVVTKTEHGYPDLIARLDRAVESNGMGVVTRASATIGAKKALDRTIPGNMIVGVYRPDFAVRMLEASIPAGIEAPIRFYITENDDGTATLSYKTPAAVFAPYSDGSAALRGLAAELDGIFAKIAAEATAP